MNQKPTRAIAFYLPQFYPIPENDAWWGRGFSEWTNVVRAKPRFPGHYQPHLPADLGFYDLRVPEVREQQAALARSYGLEGFCYYHYWFRGRRVLDRVFREVLSSGRPRFPFCLCWANEPWTRNWDGSSNNPLIVQDYDEKDDLDHIRVLIRAFRDPRYIKVLGRPLLLIYRVQSLPNPKRTFDLWRSECAASGVAEPYICKFNTHGNFEDPASFGCDAAAQFPPHGVLENLPATETDGSPSQTLVEYEDIAAFFPAQSPAWTLYPAVFPGWDNSPRRPDGQPLTVVGSTPERYEKWLKEAAERSALQCPEPIVFINAWNEWAEGAHLEPDERFGRAFLEATARVILADGPPQDNPSVLDLRNSSPATHESFADLYLDLYESYLKLQRYNSSLLGSIGRLESRSAPASQHQSPNGGSPVGASEIQIDKGQAALAFSSEASKTSLFSSSEPGVALYLDLLKKCLTRYIFEDALVDQQLREEGRDWPTQAETMIGLKRLDNLQDCVAQVISDGVEGDLVETGVWRGGAAIFMRAVLAASADRRRRVWVADSFQGLPRPNPTLYPADRDDTHWEKAELAVSQSEVAANFERYGLLDDQVRFLPGWFSESLPNAPIEQIAVLRLDGDMYESTTQALTFLYPKLSVGGYLIVDDYGYISSCRQAIEDFRAEHGITDPIEPIDWTGVFWRRSSQGPFR